MQSIEKWRTAALSKSGLGDALDSAPNSRRPLETGLIALAGLLLLIVAALFLVRQIQPTVLELEARAAPASRVQLEVESSGSYIPYYVSEPERARVPETSGGYGATSFVIVNEGTPFLHLLLDRRAGQLEIRSVRLRTLFARRDWSASQLTALWMPTGGVTRFRVEQDALTFETNGQDASLTTRANFAPEIASLHRIDDTILSVIAICAVVLLVLVVILRWRRTGRLLPTLSLPTSRTLPALLLIILLFGFGAARVLTLTTHRPLVGYANTGDFFRLLACYGLQAVTPLDVYDPRTLAAPVSSYARVGNPIKEDCYLSSQTFLIDTALLANSLRAVNDFDLQTLGITSAIFLCVLCGGLLWLYARLSLRHALYLSVCFAFLFTDPFVTLFANTFLSEFSAIVFAITSVALAAYILFSKDWSLEIALLLGFSLFLLGTSRLQNLALPLLISAWLGLVALWQWKSVVARRRIPVVLSIALSGSLVAFGLQQFQNARPGYMNALRMVNRADAYFGALLPAMRDPRDALLVLGLPRSCAPYIGKTWYDMQDNLKQCARAVRELPAAAFLRLVWHDPTVVARLTPMVIDQTRPWLISYVGQVEGGAFESFVTDEPGLQWSIANPVRELSPSNYRWLISFLGVGAVLAGVVLGVGLFQPMPPRWSSLALLQWLLTAIFFYVTLTALLGDGLLDFAKHTFLGKPALLLGNILGVSLFASILWRFARSKLSRGSAVTAAGSTTPQKTSSPSLPGRTRPPGK